MTTIPPIAGVMHTILTEEADRAGWQTGFVQRGDATLTGSGLIQTLVFGLGADPHASLSALTQTAAALGITISPEALHQRFGRTAASCLEQVRCAAIRQMVDTDPVVLPLLERFGEVVVHDSTVIAVPESLAAVWQGCGNGTAQAGNAALKVQVALDLRTGRLRGPTLHDGRESDDHATMHHDLPPGAVRLVDLGFFDVTTLADLDAQGIFWFSRMHAQTAVQTTDEHWWSLPDLLAPMRDTVGDWSVRIGRVDQVPARLIAVRVPHDVVDQRRRRLRTDAKAKGQTVSAVRLALAAWSVFITTIPADLLTVTEALVLARARWQIEMLFKLWKSQGQIDLLRNVQPWRVVCELDGRLLNHIVQHWLRLMSGWEDPARSWGKAAQTIRTHGLNGATALARPDRLIEAITTIARCIQAGCRKNRRKKHPATFQRFLNAIESCVI